MIFLWYDSKIFQNMTLRTFNIFRKNDSKKLIFFESYPKNWTFFTMTLRIEPIFPEWDSENWTPLMWLKDVVLCIWLEKLNFLNMTQRFELFLKNYDSLNWTLLFNMTQRIEPFFSTWPKELIPSFQHDSKNWTLLFNMTQRIEPFCSTWLKELNPSFFSTWLTVLNLFFNIDSLNLNHDS